MKKKGWKKMSLAKETLRTLSGGSVQDKDPWQDSGGSDTGTALCPSDPRASWCPSCYPCIFGEG